MPTWGSDSRGFHSDPDYRALVDRLSFGRTMGRLVTFDPDECWILSAHIQWLKEQAGQPLPAEVVSPSGRAEV